MHIPGSRRSSSTKSSKARLAIAQLKVKNLEEEQRLKAVEYELEKQRLQIEIEREPLGARVEVEQAQIELSDGSDIRNFCSFRCLCRLRPFRSQTEGCRCLCTRARTLSRIVFFGSL